MTRAPGNQQHGSRGSARGKSCDYRPRFQSGSEVPEVSAPLQLLLGPCGAAGTTGSQGQTPGLELPRAGQGQILL